ncbi:MAG TPA: hypothetical protein VFK20_05125 [Vicinamibacterales bacterium]|nr:hypothetical protein [Vicinamibacterales bacterium]
MVRNIIRLAVFLLVANALYRTAPVYLHYQQFKDGVHEVAVFGKGKSDDSIRARVMELAEQYDIPIDSEDVAVRHEGEFTYIDVSYVEDVAVVPGYIYHWAFDVNEKGWTSAL